jgi:hypothetical protein
LHTMAKSELSVIVPHIGLIRVQDEIVYKLLLCLRNIVACFKLCSQSDVFLTVSFAERVLD